MYSTKYSNVSIKKPLFLNTGCGCSTCERITHAVTQNLYIIPLHVRHHFDKKIVNKEVDELSVHFLIIVLYLNQVNLESLNFISQIFNLRGTALYMTGSCLLMQQYMRNNIYQVGGEMKTWQRQTGAEGENREILREKMVSFGCMSLFLLKSYPSYISYTRYWRKSMLVALLKVSYVEVTFLYLLQTGKASC